MFAEKHYPDNIAPEELDTYLERGWYRMGQTIFTTHFLCFDNQFFSAIWVRLPLKEYQFRKSLRKLYNRNNRLFRTSIQTFSLSEEKEELYQHYKTSFPGAIAPSLKESLLDGEDFNIYNTYEVTVYEKNKLVAVSFIDAGNKSAASIMGIYDPDYSKYSLGFFTMLIEINYCQLQHFDFYYPGYVVPGNSRFDYKLRIGDVSYYDLKSNRWHPFSELEIENIPITKMKEKLHELENTLKQKNIPSKTFFYPLFEANLFGFWRASYFDFPVFLLLSENSKQAHYLVVVYEVREEAYVLMKCTPFDDMQFYFNESYANSFNKEKHFLELVVLEKLLVKGSSTEDIIRALTELRNISSNGLF